MRLGVFLLWAALAGGAQAAQERVYLLVTANLGGSALSQSVLLHEPEITRLEDCEAARLKGIRERDWMHYHHIFRRDRMQGFTVQRNYRCVVSEQLVESWNDAKRYDHAYLLQVDATARLQLRKINNLAECTGVLARLSEDQRQQALCTKSNQLLRDD